MGWMLREEPVQTAVVRDLLGDPVAMFVSRWFLLWATLGLALPAAVGGWLGGWAGAWRGFIWGGPAAGVSGSSYDVEHINSMCHLWGTRTFATSDDSRNNLFCAIFTLGEGWHNNHHRFPTSARHGLGRGQFDVTYRLICALAACGLTWDVKPPSAAAAPQAAQPSDREPAA